MHSLLNRANANGLALAVWLSGVFPGGQITNYIESQRFALGLSYKQSGVGVVLPRASGLRPPARGTLLVVYTAAA